jgi:hypothetical protein
MNLRSLLAPATLLLLLAASLAVAGTATTASGTAPAAVGIVPAAPATTTAAVAAPLTIEARLLEIAGTPPPNDLYSYVYIVKYKVEKVVAGKLEAKELLVGHYNPLQPRDAISGKMKGKVTGKLKQLRVGERHLLKLVPLGPAWDGPIEDEYFDNTDPRWFAVQADPAP